MPQQLTSKETKAAIIEQLLLFGDASHSDLEYGLGVQSIEFQVISYNTIQIKVLPCNSGAWRYFTLKISEQQ